MVDIITSERQAIEQQTEDARLAEGQARLEQLDEMHRTGAFIGSIWAYGVPEGRPVHEAETLWMPVEFGVSSGRTSIRIHEWSRVSGDSRQSPSGSGELQRDGELLMGIFETMVGDGLLQPVTTPPGEET